ncbi:MAG: hypothetical protein J6X55_06290 [Victivallales bacterium]|nr:hypothetical protein [Victivallales bacterium]
MQTTTRANQVFPTIRDFLDDLSRLNPDYTLEQLSSARALANAADVSFFPIAAELVERAIQNYLSSPQKHAGDAILQEYYALLESEEHRLLTSGDLAEEIPDEIAATSEAPTGQPEVMALVPHRNIPPLTRCIVLNKSHIPPLLSKAADAYKRRNIVVDTVVEIGFDLLWRIDGAHAEQWCIDYLEKNKGALDPDVIRDFLRVALRQDTLTPAFLDWIIHWCGDMRLLENWPNVIYTGDRVLCIHAIRSWLKEHSSRNHLVAYLKLLLQQGKSDDDTLLHWLESALELLADCVGRIMSFSELATSDSGFGDALFSELKRLASVYPLVMMTANQLLCLPDGPHRFAQAVFGLAGDGLRHWDNNVNTFCASVIKRFFILDMRAGRTPVETIRRLTFGDEHAFRHAMAQLDLVAERFDSPRQREKVIEILVPFYASFRQDKFLAIEITRRYRKVMRMLHADFLAEVLSPEQFKSIQVDDSVFDLASLIGDARKFLDRRRDQTSSLERVLAARIDFEETTRKRRLTIIRRQLFKN